MVSAICPSGVLDEQSHQQAVQPQSSSWSRLWQSLQPLVEGVVEDCCWISQVLPQLCRRGSVTNFGGWNLDLHRCLACALQHFPMSYRDSADSSPGHCAAGHYCFVPRALAVLMRDRYQTIEAQTAADWLGVHDSGCGPQLLMEQAG